ncbi:alpha/beta hydrolase [Amycolatopsis rhizosphaerae]|uniref:Alpha/beta hydrolase n=1 Tax=Amycolatopsis rhizosphaerae TaxID=2053003 RepID=A0A558C0J3_9PSEU|nr:alpha/beta hydrolase [Amycolatopsis rhizosphaerae]TVT42288.1 alpha/beta hydrolase [Amycolatopsis rhizosphaerae]
MPLKTLPCGNAAIAFRDSGSGEPILLVHASLGADWFAPVEGCLPGHRVIRTHRAGYGLSQDLSRELTVADHAEHLAKVLRDAGIERAHVVGHSSGGNVALQLAAAQPELVRSLVLLEPAVVVPGESRSPAMGTAIAAARNGEWDLAFDTFLDSVVNPGFRDLLARTLGAAGMADSIRSSEYFFTYEIAALVRWDAFAAGLETLEQPTLLVDGGDGLLLGSPYHARNKALAERIPHALLTTLPGVSHAMPLEDSALVAQTIVDFIRKHPIRG